MSRGSSGRVSGCVKPKEPSIKPRVKKIKSKTYKIPVDKSCCEDPQIREMCKALLKVLQAGSPRSSKRSSVCDPPIKVVENFGCTDLSDRSLRSMCGLKLPKAQDEPPTIEELTCDLKTVTCLNQIALKMITFFSVVLMGTKMIRKEKCRELTLVLETKAALAERESKRSRVSFSDEVVVA